ncbi:MAG: hypothetical protein PVG64_06865 [Syntrophobacterales bacterium]|jgi:hypothetical protein
MRQLPSSYNIFFVGLILMLVTLISSCGGKLLMEFSLDTVPLILTPAEKTGVEDYRGRFREIYCAVREDHGHLFPDDKPCEEVIWRLADEPLGTDRTVSLERPRANIRVLVVPGFMSGCGGEDFLEFSYSLKHLETIGYKTGRIVTNGRSSSAYNAVIIRDAILAIKPSEGEQLILVGHSKGVVDILETLVTYPSVVERVTAVVSITGAVSGSPLADGLSGLGEFLRDLRLEACEPGDGNGWKDLKRSTRMEWFKKNKLPQSVSYFSLGAFAPRENISSGLWYFYDRLARVDPRNDSQLIFYDMIIPGSVLLGYVNADHWAVAIPVSRNNVLLAQNVIDKNDFPREVLLESVIRTVQDFLSID